MPPFTFHIAHYQTPHLHVHPHAPRSCDAPLSSALAVAAGLPLLRVGAVVLGGCGGPALRVPPTEEAVERVLPPASCSTMRFSIIGTVRRGSDEHDREKRYASLSFCRELANLFMYGFAELVVVPHALHAC